jgi:signal transduction histidine kinase
MKRDFKFIETNPTATTDRGPYQEMAIYVRDLLGCDLGMVALLERDSIRIQAVAGPEGEATDNLASDLMSRLRDMRPLVVDDARLIAVPISSNGHVVGVLVGYSSTAGTFTHEDLEKLQVYSHVAAALMGSVAEENSEMRTNFTNDELRHFFRLITMGEFSACFAHEVRNPLMLMRGHLRFINDALKVEDPLRSNFEAIDRASRRIEDMAKRMLDFSKKRTRRTEPFNIAELISDALRFVEPYVQTKFIEVNLQLEPPLPHLEIDRWQMVQAIVNLLQNAADAMAEMDRRVLTITANVDQKQVRIGISDTGKGIVSGDLSRIFEPFFTTKGDRGTGLGLYVTRQVIEEHGGTLSVQTSNHGTSFNISLPL